jgi:hypothetical protein
MKKFVRTGFDDGLGLRIAMREAAAQLPADWLPVIGQEARAAKSIFRPNFPRLDPIAAAEVWKSWTENYGGAAASDLSDAQIKARATACALDARNMDIGLLLDRPWHEYDRLVNYCRGRDVEPPGPQYLLKGMGARVRCQYWWRRALRRMVARKSERGAMALGLVSKAAGAPYASDRAVFRRLDQNARNAQAMAATIFENDEGYRRSLADLAAASTSNKAIRRGELMTRIRGCEAMADELGHEGLFITLTAPSRFHPVLRHGARNKNYQDGTKPGLPALTPRDSQQWHCTNWARARAALARLRIRIYGFRVAEPHHDGCTHWHMLIWSDGRYQALETVCEVLRDYWLRDAGTEPGAQKYRVAFKRMESGGAAGYIAKYIAKNIDDHGIDSHVDDYAEGEIGPDLLGDIEIKPAMRVEAWAAHWGIRQFQPLGQPPVTVWRELRRVKEGEARKAGVGGVVHSAWTAAQRVGGVLADWARYVKAQGGLMLGRACRIVMAKERRQVEGQYGEAVRDFPLGVALNVRGARVVWSERRLWRAVEARESDFAVAKPSPRTRVNNCTDGLSGDALAVREYLDSRRAEGPKVTKEPHAGPSRYPVARDYLSEPAPF